MGDQIARNGTGSGETLLPIPLSLSDENKIDMVVVCDSQQACPSITMEDVDGDVEAFLFELSFVWFQFLDCLSANRLQQLVVAFRIDGEWACNPGSRNHVGWQHRAQENMAVGFQQLVLEQVLERFVSRFGSVECDQDLGRVRFKLGAWNSYDLLLASFSGHRRFFKRVRRFQNGRLRNVGDVSTRRGRSVGGRRRVVLLGESRNVEERSSGRRGHRGRRRCNWRSHAEGQESG